ASRPRTCPGLRRTCSLSWAAGLTVDLPDRAEVVGEVCDAGDHSRQLDVLHVARSPQRLEPTPGFASQSLANLVPLRRIDARDRPGLLPVRIGERVATLARPSVHERQAVAQVLRVSGDAGAAIERARGVVGRQLVQRSQQAGVPGVQNEPATWTGAVDQLAEERREDLADLRRVHGARSLSSTAPS